MFDRADIVYEYDGSYDGFMCCVFESFRAKELPAVIHDEDEPQESLFPIKYIETDMSLSLRVKKAIPVKISSEAEYYVKTAFMSCEIDREISILRFLILGFEVGARVTKLTTDDIVDNVWKKVRKIGNEAHYFIEFLRFSEYEGFLAAEIEPKNNVLPRIVHHFCDRFPSENLIIYDKLRKIVFMYKDGEMKFLYDTVIDFPKPDEKEQHYRQLWKMFYTTIAVQGRQNDKLRTNNMPKWYRKNMTEFL